MLAIPYILTVLYAFFGKKHKYFWVWCFLIMSLMMLTASEYADYYNYNTYFEAVVSGYKVSGFEALPIAWTYLCKFFGLLHFSYRGMQFVIIAFSMYLMNCLFRSMNIKNNITWGLFLLFPLPLQCAQTRFFLGTTLFWFGFGFLVREEKKSWLKFSIFLVLSICIHRACTLYIVVLLVFLVKKMHIRKTLVITAVCTIALYMLIGYVPQLAAFFLVDSAYIRYFASSITQATTTGIILVIIPWVLSIVLSCLCISKPSRAMEHNEKVIKKLGQPITESKFTLALIFVGITLPLMKFDNNFCRYVMTSIVFSYIPFAVSYYRHRRNNRYVILLGYMIMIAMAIYIYIPYDGLWGSYFRIDGFYSLFM